MSEFQEMHVNPDSRAAAKKRPGGLSGDYRSMDDPAGAGINSVYKYCRRSHLAGFATVNLAAHGAGGIFPAMPSRRTAGAAVYSDYRQSCRIGNGIPGNLLVGCFRTN